MMEAQLKAEQQGFLETVKYLQHRTIKCEQDATIYSEKLEEYKACFEKERAFFEEMCGKIELNFVDVQSNLRVEFDSLREFVTQEMYMPLKKTMTMIDSHTEYMQ